jgi:uncharacterized protein (TIGR02266 family)
MGTSSPVNAGLRAAHRYPTSLNVALKQRAGLLPGTVTNISTGGMFVRTERSMRSGTVVSFALEFPDGEEPAPARAAVVYVAQSPETGAGHGMKFIDEESTFRARVDRHIEAILRESETPVVKLLSVARDLLRENGWTQLAPRNPEGRYCLSSALSLAAGDDDQAYQAVLKSVGSHLHTPACALGGFGCHCAVIRWNDAEGRTEKQVIIKLDEVIDAELLGVSQGP